MAEIVSFTPPRNARATELLDLGRRCREALDNLPPALGAAISEAIAHEVPADFLDTMRSVAALLESAFDQVYSTTSLSQEPQRADDTEARVEEREGA